MRREVDLAGLEELQQRVTDVFDNLRQRLDRVRQREDEVCLQLAGKIAKPLREAALQTSIISSDSTGSVTMLTNTTTCGETAKNDEVVSFHSDDCDITDLPGRVTAHPQQSDVSIPAVTRRNSNLSALSAWSDGEAEKSSLRKMETTIDAIAERPHQSCRRGWKPSGSGGRRNGSGKDSHNVLFEATKQFSKLQQYTTLDTSDKHRLAFVSSKEFTMVAAAIIIANTVYLGVQTDASVRRAFKSLNGPVDKVDWVIGDLIFAVLFTIELLLRMYSSGIVVFVFGRDRVWNIFDALIVVFSVFEVAFELFGESTDVGLSALRAIRLIKIFRILRVAKIFPLVRHLQTMLYSLYGCLTSFVPAIFLLVTVMYIYSLSFMQGVQKYVESTSAADLDTTEVQDTLSLLEKYFGSVSRTIWTLLASVSGGDDWQRYVDPLSQAGGWYECLFVVYICTVLFGLLNIVTGVFVHVAMQSSQMAREIAVDLALAKKENLVKDIVEAFLEADQDQSGSLSWSEFHEYMADEKVQAYFMSLDIDVSSAEKIFNLIDDQETGDVDLEEFVIGCLNYRGHARTIDVRMIDNRTKDISHRLGVIETSLQSLTKPLA